MVLLPMGIRIVTGLSSMSRFPASAVSQALGALLVLAASTSAADGQAVSAAGRPSAQDLANAANNPNAPIAQLELRNVATPNVPGLGGTGNLLQVFAVLPFEPSRILPFPTMMKVTAPIVTVPGAHGTTALGDIQVFDQVVFNEPWGSWAIGLSAVFPSATAKALGQDTWQLGPAAGIMFTGIENLVVGAIFQNPVSLDSSSHRPKVNALSVAPTLTYNLPDGWFVGYSDFNWSFNWEEAGGSTIPLGIQAGKVVRIDKQPFSLSLEAGYNLVRPTDDTGIPGWMIGIEMTALFPGM
jgi:hypothetical protein